MFKRLRNRKGFTIIELIVVMAVLAILVAMGVPRYLGYTKDAQVTAMKTDSKILEQAAYQYALNNSDAWPVAVDETTGNDVAAQDAEETSILDTTATPSKFTDANLQAVIEGVLKEKIEGIDDTNAADAVGALIDAGAFVEIDKTKVNPFIRSLKNDVENYFLVKHVGQVLLDDPDGTADSGDEIYYNDELEGRVFFDKALVDSAGNYHSGLE